jgi:hypothetical protein
MATLAAPRPRAGPSFFMPRCDVGPTLGTSGIYRAFGGELHGQELRSLFDMIGEVYRRLVELPTLAIAEHMEDDPSYNPVSPVRTFQAKVAFVNLGPMPPMRLDYFDD